MVIACMATSTPPTVFVLLPEYSTREPKPKTLKTLFQSPWILKVDVEGLSGGGPETLNLTRSPEISVHRRSEEVFIGE